MIVRPTLRLAALFFASATFACTSDTEPAPTGEDGTEPVYALTTAVYDIDSEQGDRTVYAGLLKTLDIPGYSLRDARELSGLANIEAMGGRLFVADGAEPTITRYSITDDLTWVERGRIGFQNFPSEDNNASFFGQFVVDDHTVYLSFDTSKRVIWDPQTLEIKDVKEQSELVLTQGKLTLQAGGNRGAIRYRDGVLQPFFYHDDDWYDFGDSSLIVWYDPETHEEKKIIEGPCPDLAVNSQDEAGNIYFSSWDYSPFFALYGVGPAPCVARITPEHELDTDFTTDLTELTGGRYTMNFRYVRDGWGLADVLHHELLDADFSGEPDPTVLDQIWDGGAFRLWRIDLEHGTAEEYTDVGPVGMGWGSTTIDGRTFLFVPDVEWTKTLIYELDADAHATKRFEVPGAASFIKVR